MLSRVEHRPRPTHARRHPLHVTMKLLDGLPSLRTAHAQGVVWSALRRGANRFGFRLVHVSSQSNHVHLVCEAEDGCALARGMKGLAVRLARNLNRLWGRTGALFADRYHARPLRTPREVRNVLAYVFHNGRKHRALVRDGFDPCSSAASFDGWAERAPTRTPVLARAITWLLTVGWRRHGALPIEPSFRPRS